MAKELYQYMDKAFFFEENGYIEEAIQLCNKCMQVFPEYKNEITLEIAKINYRNGKEKTALEQFLLLYQKTGNGEICSLILDAYYYNQQQKYRQNYQKNCKQLENYPYFFGTIGSLEIRYYPIFIEKNTIWYYDNIKKEFKITARYKILMDKPKDIVYFCNNFLWIEDILLLEKLTKKIDSYMDYENPMFLVYQRATWELLLQLIDLEDILKIGRIVLCDKKERIAESIIKKLFDKPLTYKIIGSESDNDEIDKIVVNTYNELEQNLLKTRTKVIEYYRENGEKIQKNIEENKEKILFLTTRYSTALQYHVRDCRIMTERMGFKTELAIEENRFQWQMFYMILMKKLADFKPDIIFMLDHFRYEYNDFLANGLDKIVWITWIQDPMPRIVSKETPMKLGKKDIVMNHYITWKKIKEIGYDEKHLIDAPAPANSDIYKPYILTDNEYKKYKCDICFVCHGGDIDKFIYERMRDLHLAENLKELYITIYKGYQKYVYETGDIFYNEEEFKYFAKGISKQIYDINLSVESLEMIAYDMCIYFNQRVFRQALVDWLIDAGFTNIKLWGNGWLTEDKYKRYAMGPAENGEVLSKIYQASKIVLGNNILLTSATRAWESMLSGAFYMSNYIPPEMDQVDIRKIVKINEEVIMFYNKTDLLQKVEYYLTHEEERLRMIEIGRKVALEKMTYDRMMKRVLEEIPKKLEQLERMI